MVDGVLVRGKEVSVTCDSCGRKVPRNKAVAYERPITFSTDLHTGSDIRFREFRKQYYCISCAKHKGIFKKLAEIAERKRERGASY
jgi:ribosomal protein S26